MEVSCNSYLKNSKYNLAEMYFGYNSRCFYFSKKIYDSKKKKSTLIYEK
jgi:hypothetical protein